MLSSKELEQQSDLLPEEDHQFSDWNCHNGHDVVSGHKLCQITTSKGVQAPQLPISQSAEWSNGECPDELGYPVREWQQEGFSMFGDTSAPLHLTKELEPS